MPSTGTEIPDAELRRYFLQAVQQSELPDCDRNAVNQQLAMCVARDPGNLIFVEKFLQNLEKPNARHPNSSPGFRLRRTIKKAIATCDWEQILTLTPKALSRTPHHIPTLLAAAAACEALDFREVGLRYLRWASSARPDNLEVNRQCGRWLARLGRYDEALACWKRVVQKEPGDAEATRMLDELSGDNRAPANAPAQEELKAAILKEPADLNNYLNLADHLLVAREFVEAQDVLNQAQVHCGTNLETTERLEDLQIAHAEHQLEIANARAQEQPSAEAEALIAEMAAGAHRVELEAVRRRAERYADRIDYRFRLAELLMATGNFAEAAKYFEQSTTDDKLAAASFLGLGECQQRMRRFREALACYEQAIQRGSDEQETQRIALYRHAVLAEAMGFTDAAEASFSRLVQLAPEFRDAASRLDKLREIRNK